MAKVGTSNPDRMINLKRLQCVVENNSNNNAIHYDILFLFPSRIGTTLIRFDLGSDVSVSGHCDHSSP